MKAVADPELELGQIESAERSRRAAVLRSLQASVTQGKCLKSAAVKDAAWELGVSTTTVWRLLRKFLDGEGRASSLAPGQRGRPKGLSQVTSTVEALIEEHLRLYYLKRERASLARVVAEIRVACKIEGLPPPARRTVQRRLDAMDAREVLRARSGAKAARQKFAAVTGANIAERPLEVVQIDHTPADVIQSDIWIGFPRAEQVLDRLQNLIETPRQTRMPGLLVHGASGIGKTMIARHLSRRYAPEYDPMAGVTHTPLLFLQAPPAPDERRFYLHILAAVGATATAIAVRSQNVASLEVRVIALLRDLGLRMIMIDEVHNLLAGTHCEQRRFLNVLRYLSNEL